MKACPSCGCYCRPAELVCPHCTAAIVATAARTAAVVLMGLTLAGCPPGEDDTGKGGDTHVVALYGVIDTASDVDDDGDGWTENQGDCNDVDAAVHPEATETAGDGVDTNCDGSDDT